MSRTTQLSRRTIRFGALKWWHGTIKVTPSSSVLERDITVKHVKHHFQVTTDKKFTESELF